MQVKGSTFMQSSMKIAYFLPYNVFKILML